MVPSIPLSWFRSEVKAAGSLSFNPTRWGFKARLDTFSGNKRHSGRVRMKARSRKKCGRTNEEEP